MTEYALILSAVAVVVFVGYQTMGNTITGLLTSIDGSLMVKVTRPGADLSRESLAYRLEQLEQQRHVQQSHVPVPGTVTEAAPERDENVTPIAAPPSLELEQLQEAWQRTIVPAVEERSIPAASVLREAHPAELADDKLTLEFPSSAAFHRQLAEEPKNATLLEEALYEVTGRRLGVAFAEGEGRASHAGDAEDDDGEPAGEERILELVKETLDATERED